MRSELFLPEADAEFREAARYYESECPGLGLAFVAAVRHAISNILNNPMAAVSIGRGARRKVVGRFPYNVLYSIEGDLIVIIGVAHQKRRPGYWKARLTRGTKPM